MAKQWKCARCSTENDESTLTCSNCRMIRGAVVVPSTFSPPPTDAPPADASPAPTEGWAAGSKEAPPASFWSPSPDIPAAAPAAPTPLWRRLPIGWIIAIVIVGGGALGGWYFSAGRGSSGEIVKQGDLEANDLRIGDCFDLQDPNAELIGDVTATPCTDAHEYEVFYVGALPGGAYPVEDAFTDFVVDNCAPAFDTYVGKAYEDSTLDIFWLYPDSEGWSAGDKSVQCAAYDPANQDLTASVKGSAR